MKAAAFFDIDGTLVQCLTQKVLAQLMIREGWISPFDRMNIALWFFGYKLGLLKGSEEIRKQTYSIFSRMSKEQVDKLFREVYFEFIRPQIRPRMREAVEKHKKAGASVFAISGSIRQLCEPLCQDFPFDGLFATELSLTEGRYSGKWEGEILEGEQKVNLMRCLSERNRFDLKASYAYADSYSDIPMLKAVRYPAAVSPDPRLRKYAIHNNWQIIDH